METHKETNMANPQIPEDELKAILSEKGPTRRLVSLRQDDGVPVPGVWHRDFNAVKAAAEAAGRPLVAMWTNGDLCGLCQRFTRNITDPRFMEWMKGSNCYFWLGGSMDVENRRKGAGWDFCAGSGIVNYFPFFCVQQKVGGKVTHQFFGSGGDFDKSKSHPDGVEPVISRLNEVLSSPPQDIDAVKAERARKVKEAEAKEAAEIAKSSTGHILATRLHADPSAAPLKPGVWYDDFNAVRDAAVQQGVPLFAMWIQPTCGFCKRFCESLLTTTFTDFMRASRMYFWLGSRTDPDRGASGRSFVAAQSADGITDAQRGYFPMCAVWQCATGNADSVLHDYRASGRVFSAEKGGEDGAIETVARIGRILAEPPHAEYVRTPSGSGKPAVAKPAGRCPHGNDGGCPAGHPHLKALEMIAGILKPFGLVEAQEEKADAPAGFAVRFAEGLDAQRRLRIVQAIADNDGHCPCKKATTPDTVCLCRTFRETGKCACGLFERYQPK